MVQTEQVYQCPICRDYGQVYPRLANGSVDYAHVKVCQCSVEKVKKERETAMLKFCRLPSGTEHMTLGSFNPGKHQTLVAALGAARELAAETGQVKWLTLTGAADRGKTHLAVGICRAWLARGRAARFAFVPLLLKELKDGFELEGEQCYRLAFDRLCRIPLLVMDDLGVERMSDWALEQLQTIIDYRLMNALPLIITTNKPLTAILGTNTPDQRLASERVASRLQREVWCRVIVLDAPEHRLSKVAK